MKNKVILSGFIFGLFVLISADFTAIAFAQPAVRGTSQGCLGGPNYDKIVPCIDGSGSKGSSYVPSIPDYGYEKASQAPGGVVGYLVSATFTALVNIITLPFKVIGWMLNQIFN